MAEGCNSGYSLRKKSKTNFHVCYIALVHHVFAVGSKQGATSRDVSLDSFKQLRGTNQLETSHNFYFIGIHIERLGTV